MAHSLESRVPFLDNDLVDFAIKLPSNFKVKKVIPVVDENELGKKRQYTKDGKYILRKALSRYLGDEIAMDNKQGFSSPDASWFRGESIEYIKRLLSKANKIFSQKIIQDILKEHLSGEKNNRLAIWSLLFRKHLKNFKEKSLSKLVGLHKMLKKLINLFKALYRRLQNPRLYYKLFKIANYTKKREILNFSIPIWSARKVSLN